jgi:predicted Holliday junction resolvase-like endonuclease
VNEAEGLVRDVVFVEIKTGTSTLSTRERRVRDAIQAGRVRWLELRPVVDGAGCDSAPGIGHE